MNSISAKNFNIEKNTLQLKKNKVTDNATSESVQMHNEEKLSDVEVGTWQAYSGVTPKNANKKSISREDVFAFLKEKNVIRTDLYEKIADILTDKDDIIHSETFEILKQFNAKNHLIWDSFRLIELSKVNGKINHDLLSFVNNIMEEMPQNKVHYTKDPYNEIVRNLKNKNGSFDSKLMNVLLKHKDVVLKNLMFRPDSITRVLKNKSENFSHSSIDYFDKQLEAGNIVRDILNDIIKGKNKEGDFDFNILDIENEIGVNFARNEAYTVSKMIAELEKVEDKKNLLSFAKSLKNGDEDISGLLELYDKLGFEHSQENTKFLKELLLANRGDALTTANLIIKTGLTAENCTDEKMVVIKNLCENWVSSKVPMFIDAAKYKTGEKKGEWTPENLQKYADIYFSNTYTGEDTVKRLSEYLSLEEDDKALNTFHKLYTLSWNNEFGKKVGVDRSTLDFILSLLTMSNGTTPKRKCFEKVLDKLNRLMEMKLPMSSKDAFENFIVFQDFDVIEKLERVNFEELGVNMGQVSQGVFQYATENELLVFKDYLKNYLKDKSVKDVDINLNPNVSSIVELTIGSSFSNTKLLFNIKKGKPVSEIKEKISLNKDWGTREEKDFEKNIVSTIKYKNKKENYDTFEILQSQSIKKLDKNGELLFEEVLEQSPVNGVYNVKRTYANGKEDNLVSARIDSLSGNEIVEKNLVSFDGTKTYYRYENDKDGNRIMDYRIVDATGKELLNHSVTFEVVDENHFISSRNGKKFEIKFCDDKLTVKNLQNNQVSEIELEEYTKGTSDKLLSLLKQIPGEELFAMKSINLKAFYVTDKVSNAAFDTLEHTIKMKEQYRDIGVLLHELGHAKDHLLFNEINELIHKDKKLFEIYNEEKNLFRENFGDTQLTYIDYFSSDNMDTERAVSEGIAETNALLSVCPKNDAQSIRSQYWQQYFPKTIAYLAKLLH